MAEDWAENVRKYAPQADPDVIAGIIRHCGIALHSRDASLVSFNDKAETDRVRESFLKKKLGVSEPDEHLDSSIAAVGETMKDEHFRHRVTVYYLLADRYGKLDAFRKPSADAVATHRKSDAAPHLADVQTSKPHLSETPRAEEAPRFTEARPSSEPIAAAAHRADGLADAAKAGLTDTARSTAAGIGDFGAAGAAAGTAGLGAGSTAFKDALGAGSYSGGSASSAGAGAAQAFVSRPAVDEPVTRSGGIGWLLWLILAIAIVLLVAYLMGYRL
jgi:hypothetical protein